jgi:hypothetical protein
MNKRLPRQLEAQAVESLLAIQEDPSGAIM